MTITKLEEQILLAIKIESQLPLVSEVGYKDLIRIVRKLFRQEQLTKSFERNKNE